MNIHQSVVRLSKYEINDCQYVKNFFVALLSVYFIFSNLRKCITSVSHVATLGEAGDFQLSKILRLASSVVNATTTADLVVRGLKSGGIPKIAALGEGSRSMERTSDNISNTVVQNVCSLGHDQNICVRLAGDKPQRSHLSSTSGYIAASLDLQK